MDSYLTTSQEDQLLVPKFGSFTRKCGLMRKLNLVIADKLENKKKKENDVKMNGCDWIKSMVPNFKGS